MPEERSKPLRFDKTIGEAAVKLQTLSDLFVHELGDILSAEKQIVKALPKMAKAASAPDLRAAFESHLEETKGQVERLERIFEQIKAKPPAAKCKAMEGLIAEGEEFLAEKATDEVRDAGLIAIAQRVEHYEIAAYGTAATYARQLGHSKAEKLLRETLAEEGNADKKLTALAEGAINAEAQHSA